MKYLSCACVIALLGACGGGSSEGAGAQGTLPGAEASGGASSGRAAPNDELVVGGLLGTLSQDEIQRGINPRMDRFARCFSQRYDAVELLGGSMEFSFRILLDGSVRWVFPNASDIGDRETERCLLETAAGARFPSPHGGEAEFKWSLSFDAAEDLRPPVAWSADRMGRLVADHGAAVLGQCGGGSYQVTLYAGPGGSVVAAGVSSTEAAEADKLDCVARAVAAWQVPDPGSYPAKVTFEIH